MSLKLHALAVAVLVSFAGPAFADEDAVGIAYNILQSTAVKTKSAGGDVILPDGWIDSRDGYQHVRFQREWNKLPVRGGDIVMTLDPNDNLVDTTQTFVPLTISKIPKLHDKEVLALATADFGTAYTVKPVVRLVVFTYANGSAKLAYEVVLEDALRSIEYTFDANDGSRLGKWDWQLADSNGGSGEGVMADDRCIGTDAAPQPVDLAGHQSRHWRVYLGGAKFRPAGESAGVMEAGNDIHGTWHEFMSAASEATQALSANYLIGERHPMFGANPGFTQALRWQFDPHKDGVSPSCYVPTIGSLDRHYSGGVANRFFYLLAEGTAPKTFSGVSHYAPTCNGASFAGIGINAAGYIWEEAEDGYMTSLADYSAARAATLKAARQIYGDGSPEMQAVAKAWSAVGVN